jgi:hypothetical protein
LHFVYISLFEASNSAASRQGVANDTHQGRSLICKTI